MQSIKEKKYKIFSLVYKYSFVFVFVFSFVFSFLVINPVFGATEYWGYQNNRGIVFPCGYEDGKLYKVGSETMEAEEACNTFIMDGSSCFLSDQHICDEAINSSPTPYSPGAGTGSVPTKPGNGTDQKGGVSINTKINNPIGPGLNTLEDFIAKIIDIALVIAIPVLVLMIIYTGFLFVSAQGSKDKLTTAKKALVAVLIGGALILGAFVISNALVKTVEEIKSNS